MNKIHICQACINLKNGVKTRIPIAHTCGKSDVKRDVVNINTHENSIRDYSLTLHNSNEIKTKNHLTSKSK